MGSSQSTRKLSVDNENSIQVSQDALDRIQAQLSARQAEQPAPPQSAPPPPMQYIPHDYFELEQRKQRASEEVYWAQRIENLKKQHEAINADMDLEYKKTLKEANELIKTVEAHHYVSKLPPCEAEKAKVLECYSTNPNKTLLCSVVVNQFNDCVCRSRVAAVSAS